MRSKITPFLLFNTEAGEAANFYVSTFKGKLLNVTHYQQGGPMPGEVMTASFEILGTSMVALNWGQPANYTEAVSFAIEPDTQEEVDYYWHTLTADGGKEVACGWLRDKYGVAWQVAPEILPRLISDPDKKKSMAAIQAMMKMKKIIIADLQKAYDEA